MLESEKAFLEREEDEKRVSETSFDIYNRERAKALNEYLEKSVIGLERIRWEDLLLSHFYDSKISDESQDSL